LTVLLLKLLLTPLLIGLVTLAGRRWGPVVNGLLVGMPLTSGPISFILAKQYGLQFATKAASGNLAGQVAMCVFCLTYGLLAQKRKWIVCAASAIGAYLISTVGLNSIPWRLPWAFLVLIGAIVAVSWILPKQAYARSSSAPPAWDLPARIVAATAMVFIISESANALGPQLSGLISTFPVFAVIFASFTQFQQGADATLPLLRSLVLGSASFALFFLAVGVCLLPLGIAATYAIAVGAALTASGFSYAITKDRRQTVVSP